MMSDIRQNNTYPEPSGRMGFGLDIKKSSKQQKSSERVGETGVSTQAMQSLKHQDTLKAKSSISKPYGGAPREIKQNPSNGTLVQPKSSRNSQQLAVMVRTTTDDELVKHMFNLPGYLQRKEKTENMQDKALNVGVLDWGRLETWRSNQKGSSVGVSNDVSHLSGKLSGKVTTKSPTFYSPAHNDTVTSESKLSHSASCRNNFCHNDGISQKSKSSSRVARFFRDVDSASKGHCDGQKRAFWDYKSFHRTSSEAVSGEGKQKELVHKITSEVESRPSYLTDIKVPIRPKEIAVSCDREARQKIERMQGSEVKTEASEQKSTPISGVSSSELRNYDISLSTKEKKNVDNKMKKKMELQEGAINPPRQCHANESKNIVLLVPIKTSQSGFLKHRRTKTFEHVTEPTQSTLSEGFSNKEVRPSEYHYEIPHYSCPLPSRAEINREQQVVAPDAINILDAELSSCATNSSNENLEETSRILDQDLADLAASRSRNPSPNRRFSFSLGRMTRSISFKESSAIPQLSSTYVSAKSGPVISKASGGLDNSNREKTRGHNRTKSSPLRRILDPLLKSKGSTLSDSTGTDPLLKRSLNSFPYKPINSTESLQNENREPSRIQAHLLLTTSNGFPLFRFVVNSNNIIVAAPMKNSRLIGTNDRCCNYVFYAIDEVKRKSGSWIHQVGKEKNCSFVYNVVGQMKVNDCSYMDISGNDSSDQFLVKESVLFSVEGRQTVQTSEKLIPNPELAAVVIKTPRKSLGCDWAESDEETSFKEKDFSWCLQENEHSTTCTVILPGGIHSLPSTGVPSSLIHRWKSGGSCDCGGWDVGCKLRILYDKNHYQRHPLTSDPCLLSDHSELLVLGEPQQDMPIFSMALMEKGKYSVEFSPSVSSLQAFFIAVSVVISSQKSSETDETSDVYNEKFIDEYGSVNGSTKERRTIAMGDAPIKYTPCPPVSPVGRV